MEETRKVLSLEEARAFHRILRAAVKAETENVAVAAEHLFRVNEGLGHRALGYASIVAYGDVELACGPSKTRKLIALWGRLRSLPVLRAAFQAGEVSWTKARLAAAAASPETDAEWTEKARELTKDELAHVSREETGEPVTKRVTLELTEEQYEAITARRLAVQRERKERVSLETVLAEACMQAPGESGATAALGAVVTVCDECGKVTGKGHAECADEVLDLTSGPGAKVKRTIPAAVRRAVLARDGGKCRFPGCTHRGFVELHHEGGWENVGHDPTRLVTLCTQHHDDRHLEKIRLTFEGTRVRFALEDGSVVGDAIALDVSKRSRRRAEQGAAPDVVVTATAALLRLELKKTEARRLIDVALAQPRAEAWTVEDLVREALRATG